LKNLRPAGRIFECWVKGKEKKRKKKRKNLVMGSRKLLGGWDGLEGSRLSEKEDWKVRLAFEQKDVPQRVGIIQIEKKQAFYRACTLFPLAFNGMPLLRPIESRK
jgi:hypothetical protein